MCPGGMAPIFKWKSPFYSDIKHCDHCICSIHITQEADGTVRKQHFALTPLSLVVQPQSLAHRIVLSILFALVNTHEVNSVLNANLSSSLDLAMGNQTIYKHV